MSTADDKIGRAWAVVAVAVIVGCLAFLGFVGWIAWAMLKAVGLL